MSLVSGNITVWFHRSTCISIHSCNFYFSRLSTMSKRPRSVSRSPSFEGPLENRSTTLSQTSSLERSKTHLPDTSSQPIAVMHCSLPPHKPLSFTSYEDYEVHYRQAHVNRCAECGRNFPTSHFLNLHIEENHDPLVGARRERGEKTVGTAVWSWRAYS